MEHILIKYLLAIATTNKECFLKHVKDSILILSMVHILNSVQVTLFFVAVL